MLAHSIVNIYRIREINETVFSSLLKNGNLESHRKFYFASDNLLYFLVGSLRSCKQLCYHFRLCFPFFPPPAIKCSSATNDVRVVSPHLVVSYACVCACVVVVRRDFLFVVWKINVKEKNFGKDWTFAVDIIKAGEHRTSDSG